MRKAIKDMGMSDWHTNILLELLELSKDGYLSSISHVVEEVTGKNPRTFSQFAKDYTSAFQIEYRPNSWLAVNSNFPITSQCTTMAN